MLNIINDHLEFVLTNTKQRKLLDVYLSLSNAGEFTLNTNNKAIYYIPQSDRYITGSNTSRKSYYYLQKLLSSNGHHFSFDTIKKSVSLLEKHNIITFESIGNTWVIEDHSKKGYMKLDQQFDLGDFLSKSHSFKRLFLASTKATRAGKGYTSINLKSQYPKWMDYFRTSNIYYVKREVTAFLKAACSNFVDYSIEMLKHGSSKGVFKFTIANLSYLNQPDHNSGPESNEAKLAKLIEENSEIYGYIRKIGEVRNAREIFFTPKYQLPLLLELKNTSHTYVNTVVHALLSYLEKSDIIHVRSFIRAIKSKILSEA